MVGGVLGLHRLYLEQIPEAFIYISTGGVFLLGVLYDSFTLGKQVQFYNMLKLGEGEEMKKYKYDFNVTLDSSHSEQEIRNGKLMTNLSRVVPFSLQRFAASVAYAILLLMVGGVLGLHRLYLEQIPEAFIYISTGGVFLLGVLYDSFTLGKQVQFYNMLKLGEGEEMKKYKNGKLMTNLSRVVPFSLQRFAASVAYAMWLGFLCWTAGSVTFGKSTRDSHLMVSALAAAVTAGVYIIGNCGRECRDLVYMWLGSFSTTFIHLRFIEDNFLRSLLFAAVVATWLGNRTARTRSSLHRPFTWKHLLFWTSLFGLLLGVIAVGATRHIFHRRVSATVRGESTVTTSVGALFYDRLMDQQRAHKFFEGDPALSFGSSAKGMWWDVDLVGRAPAWADMAAVFVVDLIHQETRVLEKRSKVEPLKWALWRMYLITKFDTSAFIAQKELLRLCAKWTEEQAATRPKPGPPERGKGVQDYRFLGTARACDIVSK
ncbi:TM2 domain protein [Cooperia oncophora]